MSDTSHLSDEQRAELVAYLDGELDEDATIIVERTLAENPALRHEADLLSRTWGLLDELPRPRASGEFAARTLTTVKLAALPTSPVGRNWSAYARRGGILATWAMGLALAALVGFLATNRWLPDPSEQLVRELPVIENLDLYREVEDLDFLKQLEQSGLFDEDQGQSDP